MLVRIKLCDADIKKIIFFFYIIATLSYGPLLFASTRVPEIVIKKQKNQLTSKKNIINKEDITSIGATSLQEALQTLGGVQLQDTSGNGSQVLLSMRGFGGNASSNTLFMVNGIPLTNPDLAPPDLNSIPIQQIEYVEVFAGSESVLYGDQAVGGTINIMTKQLIKDNAAIGCSIGSYHQVRCHAALSKFINKINYSINVLRNQTDNYRDHNDYAQNLLSGTLNYAYQTGSVIFDYKIANENMQFPGALTSEQVRENRRQANNDTDYFKDFNGFYHIHYKQELSQNWNLDMDMVRRSMDGNGVLTSGFNQDRFINYLKPQIKGTMGETLVTTGLDIENDSYRLTTDFGLTDDKLIKYGIFALVNMPIYKKLSLEFGARAARQNSQLVSLDDSSTINSAMVSTIELKSILSEYVSAYLRRAGSFRFPKADENASASPVVNGLKTQQGVSYEAGLAYHGYNTMTRFSLYQLNLKDEITFDPNQTPQDPFGTNRNFDPTVRKGFSISEKISITEKISLGGQYHLINARFQSGPNAGNRIPLVAESNFQANLNYQLSERWTLFTEAIYMGNQFAANDDANIVGALGGYTFYNMNVKYEYKSLIASFRVNNITNKYYYFYSVFNIYNGTESFYPAPGINALLTVSYVVT